MKNLFTCAAGWVLTLIAASVVTGSCRQAPASVGLESLPEAPVVSFAAAAVGPPRQALVGAPAEPTFYRPQISLRQLVETAFRVTRARTVGGPEWMDDNVWQVSALAADPLVPYAVVRDMLKSLLSEQFGLRSTVESSPVTAMVLSFRPEALGAGIRRSVPSVDCRPFLEDLRPPYERPRNAEKIPLCGGGHIGLTPPRFSMRSAPISNLAETLEVDLRRVVLVEPALDGLFDVDFSFPAGFNRSVPDNLDIDAIARALEEQLGASVILATRAVNVLRITEATRPHGSVAQ